jgi:hypothetical protein
MEIWTYQVTVGMVEAIGDWWQAMHLHELNEHANP